MTIDLRPYRPALSANLAKAPPEPVPALHQAKAQAQAAADLQRSVGLLESALAGGTAGFSAFAEVRRTLGSGDAELAQMLDELQARRQAEEEFRLLREGRSSVFAALKQVARLPLPLPQKAAVGRALAARALEGGFLGAGEREAVEAGLLSEAVLQETRAALAGTAEPGAAQAIVEEAKQQGLLVPHDEARLDGLAAERAPVEVQRHLARLAWKEQDDLAAYARGELPEPLNEAAFSQLYGAQGAPTAWKRYQAARAEAAILAQLRGKPPAEIEAVRSASTDSAVFDAAQRRDALARLQDPVGYLLETLPGLKQAAAEIDNPAEREALLWSAQEKLGLEATERSFWTAEEERRLADAWDALPPGSAGRAERLAFIEAQVVNLPAEHRPAAIARLVRQGIVDGTEAELHAIVAELEAGRRNIARQRVGALGRRSAALAGPQALSPSDLRGGGLQRGQQEVQDPTSLFKRA